MFSGVNKVSIFRLKYYNIVFYKKNIFIGNGIVKF